MDSPEENRTPSVSPPSSSTHQDSSLSAFLENLSPLNPDRGATRYAQGYSLNNLFNPQSVLSLPRVDQQQEMTFRDGIDGASFNFFGYGDDTPLESQPMRSSETGFTDDQDTTDHQSNMYPAPFSGGYYYHQNILQQAADGQMGGENYQLFPQPLHSTPAYANFAESSRSALSGPVRGADQHQRSSIRRHLQFGVPGNDNLNLSLTGGPIKLENHVEPSWISSNHLQAPTFPPSFYPSQSFGSAQIQNINYNDMTMSNLTQHLYRSTLAGFEPNASDSTARMILAYNMQAQQNQLPYMNTQNYLDNSSFQVIPRKTYAHMIDNLPQNHPAATVSSAPVGSYESIPSENSSQEPIRKKAKPSKDDEDIRKCSCKKSKCVKLYCECFTAGIYCLDICGCEECLNRPDYDEVIIEAKEHAESRNPLAFGSKVYKHAPNSPANELEEGNLATPSSARHKRGCNCKKSKCAKKYCECFQNGVGCSNGCRCDNCDNFFGKRKGDSRGPIYRRTENLDNTTYERLEDQDAGRIRQLSLTREEPADMSHMTQLAVYHSGMVATSASQGGTLQSSASNLHGHYSPSILTLKSYGTTVFPEVNSESLPCSPTEAVKVSSMNSPPRNQSQELMSSSSQGLQSGRRFTFPAAPPFPPLTPNIKSKDETQQTDGAKNEDSSESHSEDKEDADGNLGDNNEDARDNHGHNNEDVSDSHGDNK